MDKLSIGKLQKIIEKITPILEKSINKKRIPWILVAVLEALKSDHRCKHGCVIVNKNKIVGKGHNRCLGEKNGLKTYHAEKVALIKSNNKKLRGANMYVVRLNSNFYNLCQQHGNIEDFEGDSILESSKPCSRCQQMLSKFQDKYGLETVFHS